MNQAEAPIPSVEDAGEDGLSPRPYSPPYSPRSPSNRSATYSPSGDHIGGASIQNFGADTVMSQGEISQSPQSPRDPYFEVPAQFSPQNSPSAPVLYGGEPRQSPASPVDNGYSSYQAPHSPEFVPVSPPDFYNQSSPSAPYSPVDYPAASATDFSASSWADYPQQVYSPDALSHQEDTGRTRSPRGRSGGASSSRGYEVYNEYAAVRQPSGPARSIYGPYGIGSAVPASGFSGYYQSDNVSPPPIPRSPVYNAQRSSYNPSTAIEFSASSSAPDQPATPLPPGSDPPTLVARPSHQKDNRDKHLHTDMPERFEQFILAEGEKKCVGKPDTRKYITLQLHDHS